MNYEIVVRSHDDVLILSRDEVSMSVGDQVLVMVVITGKITVQLRGNPLVRESEGLGAQVWLQCMSNMFAFKEPWQNRR